VEIPFLFLGEHTQPEKKFLYLCHRPLSRADFARCTGVPLAASPGPGGMPSICSITWAHDS
jgi:hypothetical protein